MKPGDHLCCLYDTEEQHQAGLMRLLRQGLEQGEKVVYIVDTQTADTILDYWRHHPTGSGQAPSTITCDETYLQGDVLDPAAMIALLQAETEQALAKGYSALRAVVEMSWVLRKLPDSRLLMEYEARMNEFVPGTKCLLFCQYDRRRFNREVLLDVLRIHPFRAVGTLVYDDFISEDTLKNTTECKEGFSCLHGEGKCLCEVEYAIHDEVLFVKYTNKGCRYFRCFGYSYICTCPIRKEIHNRYRI
jgi:hypothetical protein